MKLKIYSEETLKQVVAMATESQSVAQWLDKARKNIATLLIDNPQEYRSFGAFWWPVKKQLIESNLIAGALNAEQFESVTTGDTALDMAGALAYHDYTAGSMNTGNVFTVNTDDGDTIDYLLDDQEMEVRCL
jgi:hypothetical protein